MRKKQQGRNQTPNQPTSQKLASGFLVTRFLAHLEKRGHQKRDCISTSRNTYRGFGSCKHTEGSDSCKHFISILLVLVKCFRRSEPVFLISPLLLERHFLPLCQSAVIGAENLSVLLHICLLFRRIDYDLCLDIIPSQTS